MSSPFAELFPSLRRSSIYLNAAGRTPLPARTLAVGVAAVARKAETPWSIGDTEGDKDVVRELFAELLGDGATAADVAVVPSCSYAMSLAARNLKDKLGARPPGRRRVLVLQDQNPSNVMQWQWLCDEEGGELCVVPLPEGVDGSWTAAIVGALATGTVAVAALPPCHWCDGSVVDLVPVAAACRANDVALVIDATQWLGAAPPIDVVGLGVCFLACSVHKWLMGCVRCVPHIHSLSPLLELSLRPCSPPPVRSCLTPPRDAPLGPTLIPALCFDTILFDARARRRPYGACLCYAPPSFWKSAQPLEEHDRNREGAQHIECLPMDATTGYPTDFQDGCRRLDSGGRPSYIVMPMLVASLTLLVRELGVPRVAAELRRLTSDIGRRARTLGFRVPRLHAPNIIGLRPSAGMPSSKALVDALKARPLPVLVGERLGAIRVSPHLYNGPSDLDALFEGLREALTAAAGRPQSRL